MRPDLIGCGLGQTFLRAGLDFALQQFAPRCFALCVATFDRRAIRVYSRAGFAPCQLFTQTTNGGQYKLIEMIRRADLHAPTVGGVGDLSAIGIQRYALKPTPSQEKPALR